MADLTPSTDRTRAVLAAVRDDQLGLPTPTGAPVRQLLHDVLGLAVAFRDAAAKLDGPTTRTAPAADTGPLPDDWRPLVDARLDELARAWADAGAWSGMTTVGGVDLPGEVCGLVAMDEVLLHGWDLARATGRDYEVPAAEAEAVLPVVTPAAEDPSGAGRGDLFGPVVDVPATAPAFDRVLGLAGRDPAWTPDPLRQGVRVEQPAAG